MEGGLRGSRSHAGGEGARTCDRGGAVGPRQRRNLDQTLRTPARGGRQVSCPDARPHRSRARTQALLGTGPQARGSKALSSSLRLETRLAQAKKRKAHSTRCVACQKAAPRFQNLRRLMGNEWTPKLTSLLDVLTYDFPMIWDADFTFGRSRSGETDSYVLGEINDS
ncbi:hypothetical protein [Bradyrhizobium huanghuaihaiense]|uniref:Cj0069 family protein n=1 Tax=Bradyrhizobium huanghuaihaiense TaxID=990078 RepID=UPI0031338F87